MSDGRTLSEISPRTVPGLAISELSITLACIGPRGSEVKPVCILPGAVDAGGLDIVSCFGNVSVGDGFNDDCNLLGGYIGGSVVDVGIGRCMDSGCCS